RQLDQRLQKVGSSVRHTAFSSVFPVSADAAALVRKVRFDFYDTTRPPASTLLEFEGLPGKGASFGVDVVAIIP
ncbi:MAG: hypothetical protein ACKV2V_19910, partial [Blastocatellia bacterium]